jgi:hypothetical protein
MLLDPNVWIAKVPGWFYSHGYNIGKLHFLRTAATLMTQKAQSLHAPILGVRTPLTSTLFRPVWISDTQAVGSPQRLGVGQRGKMVDPGVRKECVWGEAPE